MIPSMIGFSYKVCMPRTYTTLESLPELHFDEVYTLEIAFLQFRSITIVDVQAKRKLKVDGGLL